MTEIYWYRILTSPLLYLIGWWKCSLVGDEEIDTNKIEGRKYGFQEALKQAQEKLQEEIQKQSVTIIDEDGGQGREEEEA